MHYENGWAKFQAWFMKVNYIASIQQLLSGYISIEYALSAFNEPHFIPELSGHRSIG